MNSEDYTRKLQELDRALEDQVATNQRKIEPELKIVSTYDICTAIDF